MKTIIAALALLAAVPAFAAEGDSCPISKGVMNTSFVGIINDGTRDILASDRVFNLRVPAALPIKFSGGLKKLGTQQVLKFTTSVQDANGYCIATSLSAQPLVVKTTTTSGNKVRGGDGR